MHLPAVVLYPPPVLEGLLHAEGRFRYFLQEVVGEILAVDIPRGYLRLSDILLPQSDRRAVLVHGFDALRPLRCILAQDSDLSLDLALRSFYGLLSVKLYVIGGLFDKAVYF